MTWMNKCDDDDVRRESCVMGSSPTWRGVAPPYIAFISGGSSRSSDGLNVGRKASTPHELLNTSFSWLDPSIFEICR